MIQHEVPPIPLLMSILTFASLQPVDLLPRTVEDFERVYLPLGYDAAQIRFNSPFHEANDDDDRDREDNDYDDGYV